MQIIDNFSEKKTSEVVAKEIVEAVKNNKNIVLGLATGSTMLSLYKEILKIGKDVDWSQVKTFNLDEYANINIESNISYHHYMKVNFFNHININFNNVFFPNKQNADTYDEIISSFGGLDIQILGVGGNGHIAFNEPGSSIDSKTRIITLAKSTIEANSKVIEENESVPTHAYTMGIDTILKAKRIICIGYGEAKRKALTVLKQEIVDNKWPITFLLKHNNKVVYTNLKL